MIPLVPLLTDTDVVQVSSLAESIVHEWGVVVFQQGEDPYCGGPWNLTGDPYWETEAEAPVVWIHGSPFTGSFSVSTGEQSISYTYPEPDLAALGYAEWIIQARTDPPESEEEASPYFGPYGWGVDSWRQVPSLHLLSESCGWCENFLYYESFVEPSFADHFLRTGPNGETVFTGDVLSEGLLISGESVYLITFREGEFIPLNMTVNPDLTVETLCRWAGEKLKSSEITALWNTWEPVFTQDDTQWVIFPIPEALHGQISTIELTRDDQGMVEYSRLFLGAVSL